MHMPTTDSLTSWSKTNRSKNEGSYPQGSGILCKVIHALQQALQTFDIDSCTPGPWNTTVSTKAVQAASAIIHIQQKFIMLGICDDDKKCCPGHLVIVHELAVVCELEK